MFSFYKKHTQKPSFICKESIVVEVENDFLSLTGFTNSVFIGKTLEDVSKTLRLNGQTILGNVENEEDFFIFTKDNMPKEVSIFSERWDDQVQIFYVAEIPDTNLKDVLPYASNLIEDNVASVAIYSCTREILLAFNQKFLDSCDNDYEVDEAAGSSLDKFFKGPKRKDYKDLVLKVIREGKPIYQKQVKYMHQIKGETYWDYSLIPVKIAGKLKYIVHNAIETTAQVRKEKLLGEQKINRITDQLKMHTDLMNRVIDDLEIGLIRFSYPDFKILSANNRIFDFMKTVSRELNLIDSLDSHDGRAQISRFLSELTKKDGLYIYKQDHHYYKIIHQKLYSSNNEVEEIIMIVIDITAEVQTKNELEDSLKIQDEVFSNISHELKTPLNLIFSSNQLMEYYIQNELLDNSKDKILKNINIIKQNCYRFTRLINNIMDSTKIDSGYYKVNLINDNIVGIVEEIVTSVSDYVKEMDLTIVFDTDVEEKIIACDPLKIDRIFLNLISNAIKFSNPGGVIAVNIYDRDSYVEITVRDSGVGMDKKFQENIFRRFYQADKTLSRNAEGSGIGLSIVKSLIDLHGGNIRVESEPYKGSTFTVALPVRTVGDYRIDKKVRNKEEIIKIELSDIYDLAI